MRTMAAGLSVVLFACGGSGVSATDAAVTGFDAGSSLDGGREALDAGLTPTDAGVSPSDAGTATFDAGTPRVDAGTQPVDAGSSTYQNLALPDSVGPYPLTTVTAMVTNGNRKTPVVAHVPTGLANAPLVVFLPGASLSTSMYLPTVERLASHGVVVVRADPSFSLFSANHAAMMGDARAVLDWALAPTGPLSGRVDVLRVGVMGHSLGGKLAVMTAFADTRVKAVFGIDPVNQMSPDVVPDQVATLGIPLGLAGETIDANGGSFGMSCAPAAGNYTTFYDAAAAAPWLTEWTFAAINHMDFVDACSGFSCTVCNDASGDPVVARARLRTLLVAFVRLHFWGESAMTPWLTGASVPAEITTRHR